MPVGFEEHNLQPCRRVDSRSASCDAEVRIGGAANSGSIASQIGMDLCAVLRPGVSDAIIGKERDLSVHDDF